MCEARGVALGVAMEKCGQGMGSELEEREGDGLVEEELDEVEWVEGAAVVRLNVTGRPICIGLPASSSNRLSETCCLR